MRSPIEGTRDWIAWLPETPGVDMASNQRFFRRRLLPSVGKWFTGTSADPDAGAAAVLGCTYLLVINLLYGALLAIGEGMVSIKLKEYGSEFAFGNQCGPNVPAS